MKDINCLTVQCITDMTMLQIDNKFIFVFYMLLLIIYLKYY